VNFIQKIAMIGALGESFLPDAFFTRALNKVSDFEIVFKFKIFFWHCVPGFIFLPQIDGSYFKLIFCNKQQQKTSQNFFKNR